jgi:hypothetical protein
MIRTLRFVMDDWEKNKRRQASLRAGGATLKPQLTTNSQILTVKNKPPPVIKPTIRGCNYEGETKFH